MISTWRNSLIFGAERERKYILRNRKNNESVEYSGRQLIDGINLELEAGNTIYLELRTIPK